VDTQTLTRITAQIVNRYPDATPRIYSLIGFGSGHVVLYLLDYLTRCEHMVAHFHYRNGELYAQFDLPVFTETLDERLTAR
jgi:hypothetical protein